MKLTSIALALGFALAGCAPSAPANTSPAPVPAVCLAALDEADRMNALFVDIMGIVSRSYDAIAENDWSEVDKLAKELKAKNAELRALEYSAKRDRCRAEG